MLEGCNCILSRVFNDEFAIISDASEVEIKKLIETLMNYLRAQFHTER